MDSLIEKATGVRYVKIWKVACHETTMMEKKAVNQLFREKKMMKVISYDGTVGFIWSEDLPDKKVSKPIPLGSLEQQLREAGR